MAIKGAKRKLPAGIMRITGTENLWLECVYRGQPIRQSAKTPNVTKAADLLASLKAARDEQLRTGRTATPALTVKQVCASYLTNVTGVHAKIKPNQKKKNIEDINAYYADEIVEAFGKDRFGRDRSIGSLTQFEVTDWVSKLRTRTRLESKRTYPNGGTVVCDPGGEPIMVTKHLKETTIMRYRTFLRALLHYARKSLGQDIPRIELGKNVNIVRVKYFSKPQAKQFLAACEEHVGTWLKELCAFIMGAGLRKNEAIDSVLTWRKVEFNVCPIKGVSRATVRVDAIDAKGKPGEPGIAHTVECSLRATAALRWFEQFRDEYAARHRDVDPLDLPVFVFRDWRGMERLKPIRFFNKQFSRALHMSKLHGELIPQTIHDLRHHFASVCVQSGVPLKRLQEWLGHDKLASTMIYAHLAPSDASRDAALVD